jgi:hypothetical protein
VAERARVDAQGAETFDKQLAEKHKRHLVMTLPEIRQQTKEQLQEEERDSELRRLLEAEARPAHADSAQEARQEHKLRDSSQHALQASQEQMSRESSNHATAGVS